MGEMGRHDARDSMEGLEALAKHAQEGGPERDPGSQAEAAIVGQVLSQYRRGWFLMADSEEPHAGPQWVQPRRRAIIPLDGAGFYVSRNVRKKALDGRFVIRCDTAFGEVITACAQPRPYGRLLKNDEHEATWIDRSIIGTFTLLHKYGFAHSVEAWRVPNVLEKDSGGGATPILVGGLYGVAIGSLFCGESMFTRPHPDVSRDGSDSSKVCLLHLVHHLRRQGFRLLDSQIMNHHVAQFGAYEISRLEYISIIRGLTGQVRAWEPFDPKETLRELRSTPFVPGRLEP